MPTICFNCEAGCGLLAYVDRETGRVAKLEGNPLHPASRGRNCPKGPATLAQVTNPDRILHPLRRSGPRGGGRWERVSWEEAMDDIAGRIRAALVAGRRDAVVHHVGRHGEDGFIERMLLAWGVDGHNSHTNVCSSGARTGYTLWMGFDRPAPDHANARFILLLSSHLEGGHYFNPHAQRIMEARQRGARLCVVDARLSNTASHADWWLSPWPGTEAGLLLAIARQLMEDGTVDREFLRRWVNWEEFLADRAYLAALKERGFLAEVPAGRTFDDFLAVLRELYSHYTPAWAEAECGVPAATVVEVAREIGQAGRAFASHVWRNAAQAHRGGWMVARCLFFLHVLTGSVGTPGGCLPAGYCKFVAKPPTQPPHPAVWNELHFPPEYPLAHFEMSFLLPHLMEREGKRLDVYFTRAYNPVWTNPDGAAWIELLTDPERIGLHVALTPVWNETAQYADYVLPVGLGPERHDLLSYETQPAQWIGFRQPAARVARERWGEKPARTLGTNPGEVWEEVEFWIELSWRIDPDGSLGIRRHFESPYRPGEKVTVDEYFGWICEHSVPGLPEAAAREGLTPLEYMRRRGAFVVTEDVYAEHERPVPAEIVARAEVNRERGWVVLPEPPPRVNMRPQPGPFRDEEGRFRVGVLVDSATGAEGGAGMGSAAPANGQARLGFPTPSGKLEFFSTTLRDWGWPEYAIPVYPRTAAERREMVHITSQVHHADIRWEEGEFILLPTFRLPTLIHTRQAGAKWLYEISHVNPVWVNPDDAARLGVRTGDLIKVETEIGFFVDRVWVTEAVRPGVVACSHHLGRWRLHEDHGGDRWNSAVVRLTRAPAEPGGRGDDGGRAPAAGPPDAGAAADRGGVWTMKPLRGPGPWPSEDPDSGRIWWREAGVHQNITFPVQADPISGAHCWHQRVRLSRPGPGEVYGLCVVDTRRSRAAFRRWLELTRPAPGPGGLRRPYWMLRPLKPQPEAYRFPAGGAPRGTGGGREGEPRP